MRRALVQLGRFAEAEALLARAALESTRALVPLIRGDFGAAVGGFDLALAALARAAREGFGGELAEARRGEVLWMRSLALYRWGRYREAVADLEAYLGLVSEQGNGPRYAEG